MPVAVRRLALALLLATAWLAWSASFVPVSAQTSCDWASYPDFCIPSIDEVGDLDCAAVAGSDFTVYQPDPHYFDGDYDGIGCESGYSTDAPAPVAEAPVGIATGCDPSYPEVCLAPAPDLDCADVGFTLTVIHDPSIGAYDPHSLDGDYDGLGCE